MKPWAGTTVQGSISTKRIWFYAPIKLLLDDKLPTRDDGKNEFIPRDWALAFKVFSLL
jgi:hypothetical protein